MIITFGGGALNVEWLTALWAWSLVTAFVASCTSPSWMRPGSSAPCAGVMLSPREPPAPLLWFRPYCLGTAFLPFPGAEQVGELWDMPGLLYSTVSQPARFTRWGKISYLFRFFSPYGWIEACVRVSVALCHIVSSGGWSSSWCTSLQHYARWLLLYPYAVFQVLDNNAVVFLVVAGNKL